ncbi:MAG: hypothetical protein Q8R36_03760 [bacterium]|nr:hypothetical protein [bacterium]
MNLPHIPNDISTEPHFKRYNSLALFVFLASIFLLPFIFYGEQGIITDSLKFIFFFIGIVFSLAFWAYGQLVQKRVALDAHVLFICAIIVFSLLFLSAVFSKFPAVSWASFSTGYSFIVFALLFILLFIASQLLKKQELVLYAYEAISASFFLSCIIWLALFFIQGKDTTLFTPFFVGTWYDAAIFSGLVVLLSVFLFETFQPRLFRALFIASFCFSFLILFITHAIPVLIILGVMLALIIFVKRDSMISVASLILVFFIMLLNPFLNPILPFETQSLSVSQRFSEITDLAVVQGTFKENIVRALLGSGPNTEIYQYDLYSPRDLTKEPEQRSADVVATFGLFGTFSWIVFFCLLFFFGTRSIVYAIRGISDEGKKWSILIFLPVLYLLILVFLYKTSFTILTLNFLFIGIYLGNLVFQESTFIISLSKRVAQLFFIGMLLIVITVSIAGIFLYTKKTISFVYFNKALVAQTEDETLKLISRALYFSKEDIYYRFLADFYLKKTQDAYHTFRPGEEQNKKIVEYGGMAVSNAQKAIDLDSKNYRNWLALGRIYAVFQKMGIKNSYTQGDIAYTRATDLSPGNELLALEWAEFALEVGDKEHVWGILKEALVHNPTSKILLQKKKEFGF